MNKKKILISLLVIVLILAAAGGGIFIYRNQKDKKTSVDVYQVSNLNWGWGEDESYSSGTVTDDKSQSVLLEDNKTIEEVYVKEGDEVQEGDPLVRFNMEESALDIEMKALDLSTAENDLILAQRELERLKTMTPIQKAPEEPEEPEPQPEPQPQPQPEPPEKDGDAYNIISLSAKPYAGDGSAKKPLQFLCTPEAYVLGEYLNELIQKSYTAVFEIHKDNKKDGDILNAWLVNGASLTDAYGNEEKWSVASRKIVEEQKEDEDTDEPEPPEEEEDSADLEDDEPEGYTAAELASKILSKEKEIRELDIRKRKIALELDQLRQTTGDGIVRAKVSGIVDSVQDPENLSNDGSSFLEIRGKDSLYVTGSLSELLLGEIKAGQKVTITSWESGLNYEGEITEISTTPTEGSDYMGEGNPNASYYPYKAQVKDSKGLRNGEGVELKIAASSGSGIYLEKAYVRTEGSVSYVMKEDKNGRLKKQIVKTGKTLYGQAVQILSGLDEKEYIAFPYGKDVKEGIKVRETDEIAY